MDQFIHFQYTCNTIRYNITPQLKMELRPTLVPSPCRGYSKAQKYDP